MFEYISVLTQPLIIVEKLLFSLLIFLEFAVIGVFAWRMIAYGKSRGDASRWIKLLSQDMERGGLPSVALGEKDKASVPGRVVRTGLANQGLAPDALEKVFEVQESAEKRELERGLPFLATVGSNAPFLGLTGTVIGILVAFDRFAASGGKGSVEVMTAISHALMATAIGLLVAIPAVVFHNILRGRCRAILDGAREVRGIILARNLNATYTGMEV